MNNELNRKEAIQILFLINFCNHYVFEGDALLADDARQLISEIVGERSVSIFDLISMLGVSLEEFNSSTKDISGNLALIKDCRTPDEDSDCEV